jgi:hypothetical protein
VLFTKKEAKTFYYDYDLLNFYYKYQILDLCILTLCNFISLYLRILHFLLSMYHYIVTIFNCFCCSVAQSCPTLCDLMDCTTPGPPVCHHLPEFVQVHVHGISDAIQPSHSLMPSSPSTLTLSQHQGLFQ